MTVSAAQYALGAMAWAAFSAADPSGVQRVLAGDTTALPFLAGALVRWLEQLPWVKDGLARTQRQILEIAAEGGHTFASMFRADQQREERIFMGDEQFQEWLRGLMECRVPLVALEGGVYKITEAGREVLAGRIDHVTLNGLTAPFRWDGAVQAGN